MGFKASEKKFRKEWEKKKIFKAKSGNNKFYCLEMFPYPSGDGLHIGHTRNYAIGDCVARFKRMQGFNVLYPMGYDSFGLPAENAAIQKGADPEKWTLKNIKYFMEQQKTLGFSYDWDRLVITCLPEYYKWNQWIFLKMLEKELAYKKEGEVNWCPGCNTVLANEQVESGKCWRCKSAVKFEVLNQWYFKITEYADKLLKGLDKLDWSDRVKTMQKNWIGKSKGVEINFKISDTDEVFPVFTTRPDTIYGVTFVVMSPEHPKVLELIKENSNEKEIKEFIAKVKVQSMEERTDDKTKEGMFIGKYATNPLNGDEVPIYIANFVLAQYGTGMIMAVPAHDQRDFEFAKKYDIPIKRVIDGGDISKEAWTGEGKLLNSEKFDGLNNNKAIEEISDYIVKNKIGKHAVNYKLRDWLISRQRYWGTPIPIIYCDKCGVVPVPEKDLPVLLPKNVKFSGHGNPLESVKEFVNTKCPKCKGDAKRETDTMDTFVDSSWYFLRYCDSKFNKLPVNKKESNKWMPIDFYIGGIEHATGHLIYARFFTKVLKDFGLVKFDEPFKRLLCQGMVTLGGTKMSKSKGNVIDPLEIAKKYSADTIRMTVLSMSLPDKDFEWNDSAAESVFKLLRRIEKMKSNKNKGSKDNLAKSKINRLIINVTDYIEEYNLNYAIKDIMEFTGFMNKNKEYISKNVFDDSKKKLVLLLVPFAPYTAEEIWSKIGKGFASVQKWPKSDKKLIDKKAESEEHLIENIVEGVENIKRISKINKPKKITLFSMPIWKYKVYNLVKKGKDMKDIMKSPEFKKEGKFVAIYFQKLKKMYQLDKLEMKPADEINAMKKYSKELEKQFNCKIIIASEKDENPKRNNAEPMKPGILLE